MFHKLNDENIKDIIKIMLKQVEEKMKKQKFLVTIDSSVEELIMKNGIDKTFGARPLRRTIQNLVEDRINIQTNNSNRRNIRGKFM